MTERECCANSRKKPWAPNQTLNPEPETLNPGGWGCRIEGSLARSPEIRQQDLGSRQHGSGISTRCMDTSKNGSLLVTQSLEVTSMLRRCFGIILHADVRYDRILHLSRCSCQHTCRANVGIEVPVEWSRRDKYALLVLLSCALHGPTINSVGNIRLTGCRLFQATWMRLHRCFVCSELSHCRSPR